MTLCTLGMTSARPSPVTLHTSMLQKLSDGAAEKAAVMTPHRMQPKDTTHMRFR